MGLPLFVAPVESDLPSKTATKSESNSPSRSGIRRLAHVSRDRQARRAARIHNAIRHQPTAGNGLDSSEMLHAQQTRGLGDRMPRLALAREAAAREAAARDRLQPPWARTPSDLSDMPRQLSSQLEATPLREALSEMTRADPPRRLRMEEQIHSLFGVPWSSMPRPFSHSNLESHSSAEPQPAARRARIARAAPVVYRFDRSPEGPGHSTSSTPPTDRNATSERSRDSSFPTISEYLSRSASASRSTLEPERILRPPGRNAARRLISRRSQGVDGLGDRDRSLSPEVWDTLLTTLTPDPQPPSASSSFASAAASHSAGASSNTTPPAPDSDLALLEAICDSGCENSDLDDPEYDLSLAPFRGRREAERRAQRAAWADMNLDGTGDGPSTVANAIGPLGVPGETDLAPGEGDSLDAASGAANASDTRDGWSRRLSVGASDDDRGTEQRRRNREGSQPAGVNTVTSEDDWSGMQRIVRSMALREDIPDEWWAEAGLSRTLSRDGTN